MDIKRFENLMGISLSHEMHHGLKLKNIFYCYKYDSNNFTFHFIWSYKLTSARKIRLSAYFNTRGLDQMVHLRRLTMTFTFQRCSLKYPGIRMANGEDPYQTAYVHRLTKALTFALRLGFEWSVDADITHHIHTCCPENRWYKNIFD